PASRSRGPPPRRNASSRMDAGWRFADVGAQHHGRSRMPIAKRLAGPLIACALVAPGLSGCAAALSLPPDWASKNAFVTLHSETSQPYLCAVGTAPKVGAVAESIATGKGETALLGFFAPAGDSDDPFASMPTGRIPSDQAYYT